jgi:hypothetical protein
MLIDMDCRQQTHAKRLDDRYNDLASRVNRLPAEWEASINALTAQAVDAQVATAVEKAVDAQVASAIEKKLDGPIKDGLDNRITRTAIDCIKGSVHDEHGVIAVAIANVTKQVQDRIDDLEE